VASGNVAKRVNHCEHGEPHRQGHAEVTDPQIEIGVNRMIHEDRGRDGRTDSGEDQKERTDELRNHLPDEQHGFPSRGVELAGAQLPDFLTTSSGILHFKLVVVK
jgi:hypothetical protein